MNFFPVIFASICAVSMLSVVSAQSGAPEALTANPVFKNNCAKCHGKNAEGRHFGGPSLHSSTVKAATNDDLNDVISHGKGRMPKYSGKLTPEEISKLIQQIKLLNQ